ncbi:hypothetical protein PILCRDRAFT_636847 [Piloderma croceum F 1598]|uniref:Uncharacterized protein n=1 Tax=Piloderma croceum (strain F 1598) TaxID=765440 RepID=A0A0C3EW85_PILCF|nr:hypothetical protein PILCRDRAFT_636847 [Piloderma croceum F 1598]
MNEKKVEISLGSCYNYSNPKQVGRRYVTALAKSGKCDRTAFGIRNSQQALSTTGLVRVLSQCRHTAFPRAFEKPHGLGCRRRPGVVLLELKSSTAAKDESVSYQNRARRK